MIIYRFIKYLILNIKYTRILNKVYENEDIPTNLSKLFGSKFKQDWIGRLYTVINPNLLGEEFDITYPEMVAAIVSDEYYVNMMRAWYFATALAKQYDSIITFIEDRKLDKWTHNKAIQKSVESYRITPEQKTYLKSLKIK